MRYRPARGLAASRKKTEAAASARQIAVGKKERESEPVFDEKRHAKVILRAENIAAGLPPDTTEAELRARAGAPGEEVRPATPPETREPFSPVPVSDERPRGLVETIRKATDSIITTVRKITSPGQHPHRELVVNSESLETRVAILSDGELEDFHVERSDDERLVGSIFKGKVTNLENKLKAAFIEIGSDKNAFLHYWDILPNPIDSSIEPVDRKEETRKTRRKITREDIPRLHPVGSDMIVQVTKAPIGTKGPRITTSLALPGRFLVLLPNSDQSGVSRKIESKEERQRLKDIVRRLTLPEGMGVIIRTAGQRQRVRYFVRDLAILLEEWKRIQERIDTMDAPACVHREPGLVDRTIREFLTEDVERVVVDTSVEYDRIKERICRFSRRSAYKIKFYEESQPIFDRFGVSRQIESIFSRRVDLRSGGYLVFDETEALVAIDVNFGSHKDMGKDQEATIFKVNQEAADEICRQLRLRNMGGIIVLDFVDMRSRKNQQELFKRVRRNLEEDKAKTHVLPLSSLGLMEMTRQRTSESMHAAAYDDCPYCLGRGHVKSSRTMSVEIQRKISELLKRREKAQGDYQLLVLANPAVCRRVQKEDHDMIVRMEKQHYGRIHVREESSFHFEQFRIEDQGSGKVLYRTDPALSARRLNIETPRGNAKRAAARRGPRRKAKSPARRRSN